MKIGSNVIQMVFKGYHLNILLSHLYSCDKMKRLEEQKTFTRNKRSKVRTKENLNSITAIERIRMFSQNKKNACLGSYYHCRLDVCTSVYMFW